MIIDLRCMMKQMMMQKEKSGKEIRLIPTLKCKT